MTTELRIDLSDPRADAEQLDDWSRSLREELLELDVDAVSPVPSGEAPPGSKGLELMAVGAMLVQLSGSVEAVTSLVSAIRSWLHRSPSPSRSLKITIDGRTLELDAATDEQQQLVVDEFLRSVTSRTG